MNDNDLRSQLDEALERIRQLEEELAGTKESWPLDWGFTNSEKIIMTTLMRHDVATKENIYFTLYGHMADPPGSKVVDVFICKIRKRLSSIGIQIQTLWGKGYAISLNDKEFIREMLRFGPTLPRFLTQKNFEQESAQHPQ